MLATSAQFVASKLAPTALSLILLGGLSVHAQTVALPAMVISASRAPTPPADIPFSVTALSGDTLRATPTLTLDDTLRSVPGFSLFRRSGSLTANPSSQGVSLRGLGPSGASRSLILLDGVPLNDPFGGWIAWTKVPRESLARAEVVRGGGASAWGNAALGGVVQLITETPSANQGRLSAAVGDFSTRNAELSVAQTIGPGTLQISGQDFTSAGFSLVAPEDRGPVDIAAWSRHRWLSARWSQAVGANGELTVSGRAYDEKRGNGTPYQTNSSQENFGSVVFTQQPTKNFSWSTVAYAQDQTYANTFSSVNAARTDETPASNQYAVPATAFGAAWTGVWQSEGNARTSAGLDYRQVRGETREYFTFANGDFTRERIAGGAQNITGVFALHERTLAENWRGTFGGRLDFWQERNGHRRETTRATGAILRDDIYPDHDGMKFSPSAGLIWQPAPEWRIRAAAQQSFRRPTLNELYRPFRVGNVITEANPALKTEHATSAELGTDYTHGPVVMRAAFFWNDFRDAVGNVTLAHGPGTFPIVGFIPAGGLGRQRLNLDRLRVQGIELSIKWQPAPTLSLSADYLYDDATVQRASLAPNLVGKRLAQVPQQSASFGATWQPFRKFALTPRIRALGRQFEDDENLLRLGAALVVDLGASYRVTTNCEVYATCENLTDARIETGRSTDGIVNTGTPRLALAGVRCSW